MRTPNDEAGAAYTRKWLDLDSLPLATRDDKPKQPFGVECDDDWPIGPALAATGVMLLVVFITALATH